MIKLLLFIALLFVSCRADACNDSCKYGEVCLDDGECVPESELVSCGLWMYCRKGQECCNWGCIPEGSVCCSSVFYCEAGHTCCGTWTCCPPGTYCENKQCKLCPFGICNITTTTTTTTTSTRAPYTTRTTRTWSPRETTTRKYTTRLPWTTRDWREDSEHSYSSASSSTFSWYYGVLVAGGIVISIGFLVGFLVWKKRNSSNPNAGTGGQVIAQARPPQQPLTVQTVHAMNPNYINPSYTAPPPPYTIATGAGYTTAKAGQGPIQTGVHNPAYIHPQITTTKKTRDAKHDLPQL